MCKSGMRPFAAIYSTFLQRAFDQVWQEVVLNNQPVVFCLDRAGYVGDDGAVHHGFLDLSFLRPLPSMVLMAPSDESELNRALRFALSLDVPSALRYPRDNVPASNFEDVIAPELAGAARLEWTLGTSRVLRSGVDATLLVYGALAQNAMLAAEELAAEGIQLEVVDARFCKPLDAQMLQRVLKSSRPVLTVEDHALQNGFGTAVIEHAVQAGLPTGSITRLGMPDRLVAHATRAQQLSEVGLDAAGIAKSVRDCVRATRSVSVKLSMNSPRAHAKV
jgi:1-deoxy-D-xylulose-5-phosphate synthase